jgi:hypothetical protein
MADGPFGESERPEALVDALLFRFPNGTLNIYGRGLRYLYVGGDGLEAVGLTAGYLQGKTLHELFPPASVARVAPFYRRAFAGARVRSPSCCLGATITSALFRYALGTDEPAPHIVEATVNVSDYMKSKDHCVRIGTVLWRCDSR